MTSVYIISVVYLLIVFNLNNLVGQRIHYKYTVKRPDNQSIIGVLTDTSTVELCLLNCSRNKDCKCVVYEEGNQCYLYGTSEGSIPLAAGHVAIVEIEREPTSGNVYLFRIRFIFKIVR